MSWNRVRILVICSTSYCCISFFVVQSFILTFLAEWGDRSQIATIAVSLFLPEQTIRLPGKEKKMKTWLLNKSLLQYLVFILYIYISAASYPQKCSRSCSWSYDRTHNLYISGSSWRKHVSIQDLTTHSCNSWRLTFPWFLLVFLLLSTPITNFVFLFFFWKKNLIL